MAVCFMLFVQAIPALAGNTYYVGVDSPGADDGNDGLSGSPNEGHGPWKTIARAAEQAEAGDEIVLLPGVYRESGITFAHSGEEGEPITLKASEPGTVVLDGKGVSSGDGILLRDGQSHFVFQGLAVRNMEGNGIATSDRTDRPYRNIVIRDCELDHNTWSGAELAAVDGFELANVTAHHNGFYGLNILPSREGDISTANGVVRNCSFHHHEGEEGHGMAVNQGHDILITGCEAFHNRSHGFDITDWPKEGAVSHDIVVEHCQSHDNGIAGFSINSDSHRVVFRRNIAWSNGAEWAGMGTNYGFLSYEGCWDVLWEHNTSVFNSAGGFSIENSPGEYIPAEGNRITFRNNLTLMNGQASWEEWLGLDVTGSGWDIVLDHNNWGGDPDNDLPVANLQGMGQGMYSRDEVNAGALGPNEISVDPMLANTEQVDFRLLPGSPAIDRGKAGEEPYCGAAPDLGAIEYCP